MPLYIQGTLASAFYANGNLMDTAYANSTLVYPNASWKDAFVGTKVLGSQVLFGGSSTIYASGSDFGTNVDFSRPTKITGYMTWMGVNTAFEAVNIVDTDSFLAQYEIYLSGRYITARSYARKTTELIISLSLWSDTQISDLGKDYVAVTITKIEQYY